MVSIIHFWHSWCYFVIDHEGIVQKDLHNNDLEFIKFKFFYNDDEECKCQDHLFFQAYKILPGIYQPVPSHALL